ncbi:hypothetical protein SELMODRAFT_431743 [Selaginella moellendorffii]|uniref:Uncharacterized protein n=1 Tax=Selaginella moellendorffii TaxID=88036 RepID=D8TDM7_SELML|nr:hypothetical protein SELMODRAFT_431743 [Selaginella moellendorffii]
MDKLTKKLTKMVDKTGALYIGTLQEPMAPDGETEQLFQKIEKSLVCIYSTSKQELEEIRMALSSNPMYLVMAVPDAKIASSMCNSSEVLITVNFQKACKDRSIEVYTSENVLIFSSGSIPVKCENWIPPL